MKNVLTLVKMMTVMIAVTMTASVALAEFKLAYVDVQKAIEQSVAGKKAKEEIKKEAEKKSKELEKKKADIDKMREDFEKKKSVLAEEALGKKAQEIQEEMQKFNQIAQKAQNELAKKEADLLQPIVDKMKKVIEKVAKEKNIAMVIQSNPNAQVVLYAQADAEITGDVVKAFDKEK